MMSLSHSESITEVRAALGGVLRRLREEHKRSLQDVASAAGISTGYLSEVERGRKDISTDRLLEVCRALEVPVGEVYRQLAQELGATDPVWAVAVEADPAAQMRRMSQALDEESLRTVARFTTFLAMTEKE